MRTLTLWRAYRIALGIQVNQLNAKMKGEPIDMACVDRIERLGSKFEAEITRRLEAEARKDAAAPEMAEISSLLEQAEQRILGAWS